MYIHTHTHVYTNECTHNLGCCRGPELGRGTFGIVSEAIDATTGEILAVKQVLASELRPKAVEVLQREMTVLRKLRHSNIVSYRGMEYEENKLR